MLDVKPRRGQGHLFERIHSLLRGDHDQRGAFVIVGVPEARR